MNLFSSNPTAVFILLFLIVTFSISSFEKITDWKGTDSFIKEHFKNSPLKNFVPFLLSILLVIEIIASILMLIGVYQLYTSEIKEMAIVGIELSAVSIIFMLIGQRLAKDYAGATSLAIYFIITMMGLFFLNK